MLADLVECVEESALLGVFNALELALGARGPAGIVGVLGQPVLVDPLSALLMLAYEVGLVEAGGAER